MRVLCLLGCGVLAALTAGCGRSGSPSHPPVVARYHFIGTVAVPAGTNAAKFREVAALPESRRFMDQTLGRLSLAPRTLAGGLVDSNAVQRGAGVIRPLLDDLLRYESCVEARGRDWRRLDWTLMVALPPDRRAVWQTNLATLAQLWGLGSPRVVAGSPAASEIQRDTAPQRIRWVDTGSWLVVGIGDAALPGYTQALNAARTAGRPVPALTNEWLEVDADLAAVAEPLDLPQGKPWPRFSGRIVGSGENLRTTANLSWPIPLPSTLPAWQVPTNFIRDPLVSFAAARGIGPLISQCGVLGRLKLADSAADPWFAWSQAEAEFQSFVAFPLPNAAQRLRDAAPLAPGLFSDAFRGRGFASFEWSATNQVLVWRGLPPLVVPNLHAGPDAGAGRSWVMGSLFPAASRAPAPQELLQELQRSNLVYYQWELTQARLMHWRLLSQFMAAVSESPQMTTNTAALPWLLAIEPRLGNSVTEASATSPSDWTMVRRSPMGLTGLELLLLARWTESATFPRLDVVLPGDARPRRAAQATAPAPAR